MMANAKNNLANDQDWARRPGVPMEAEPHPMQGARWRHPERQEPRVKVLRRAGLEKLTPVFGTAQPPRGLSGRMRMIAYRIPENKAAHWGVLLAADRVDALEGLLIDSITRKPYVGIWALLGVGLGFGLGKGKPRKEEA